MHFFRPEPGRLQELVMTSCEAVKVKVGGDQQVAPNSLAALDAGWSAGSAPGQIPKLTLRRLSETVLLATSFITILLGERSLGLEDKV